VPANYGFILIPFFGQVTVPVGTRHEVLVAVLAITQAARRPIATWVV